MSKHPHGHMFVVFVASISRVVIATPPTTASATFLSANEQSRLMVAGDRVIGLYGNNLIASATSESPAALAQRFVDNHGDALGIDGTDLELFRSDVLKGGLIEVFSYRQKIGGIPVHGSVVKIPVYSQPGGASWTVGFIGARLTPHPENPLPSDEKTAQDAKNIVSNSEAWEGFGDFGEATKVVYEAPDQSLHRVWTFRGSNGDQRYAFYVDTHSGAIVDARDVRQKGGVSGTVRGGVTRCRGPLEVPIDPYCCYPDGECFMCCPSNDVSNPASCPTMLALPRVEVGVTGGESVFTQEDGFYAISGLVDGQDVTVTTRLTGEWVTVDASTGNLSFSEVFTVPSNGGTATLNIDLGLTETAACHLNPSLRPPAIDTLQVNAYYAISKTHEWFRNAFGGPFPRVDQQVPCIVYPSPEDGASYTPEADGGPLIQLFGAGYVSNLYIAAHEYGHFIVDQVVATASENDDAFNEGSGDLVAALVWDAESNPYGYSIDYPDVQVGVCGPGTLCPDCSYDGSYCRGTALNGAFWDLRKIIGREATSELFIRFLFLTRGLLDQGVLAEVLAADDDDGNLCNDSEHKQVIITAFAGHGWTWDNNQSCEGARA